MIVMNDEDGEDRKEEEEFEEGELKLKDVSEFLREHNINLSKWFEWFIDRNRTDHKQRLKSAKTQFWVIVIFLAGISGGLLAALLTDKILGETFIAVVGIIIGYMFYMIKYSAISPVRRRDEL